MQPLHQQKADDDGMQDDFELQNSEAEFQSNGKVNFSCINSSVKSTLSICRRLGMHGQ